VTQLEARAAKRRVTAQFGVLDFGVGPQAVRDPSVELDAEGKILALGHAEAPLPAAPGMLIHDLGRNFLLPGLVNAHSHAFQRAIRGRTGRRGAGDPSSFWSWREAMYSVANELDPEGVYEVTRRCFDEMLRSGITCVGEFHYLHHQPDGRLYAEPHTLSSSVIRAASDSGIRLVLLEVYYARAGHGRPSEPGQRRFCDPSVEHYLERVAALCDRGRSEGFSVGVAPHSVRAVAREDLEKIAAFASEHDLVMHAHVSEQVRENRECHDEHGCSPLALFERSGCLSRPGRFTAVHAIALEEGDLARLSGQRVCACPTTEADLGDGVVPARELLDAGVSLCLGSDSNATIDLVQEARLLEMNERLTRQARLRLADETGHVAPGLLLAATAEGALSLGRPELGRLAIDSPFDAALFSLDHPSLADVASEYLLDALFLAGSAAACEQVWVAGERRA
jgi:formimidoylglutamate deiminase